MRMWESPPPVRRRWVTRRGEFSLDPDPIFLIVSDIKPKVLNTWKPAPPARAHIVSVVNGYRLVARAHLNQFGDSLLSKYPIVNFNCAPRSARCATLPAILLARHHCGELG
jgi:hypothetical protein